MKLMPHIVGCDRGLTAQRSAHLLSLKPETKNQMRYPRDLCRGSLRLDRWVSPGGELKPLPAPRVPRERSPRRSKLGRNPEAFPLAGEASRTKFVFLQLLKRNRRYFCRSEKLPRNIFFWWMRTGLTAIKVRPRPMHASTNGTQKQHISTPFSQHQPNCRS